MKTIDRIMLFIKHLGFSVRKFDISIGASNGYTLRMNKNHASVGSDVIENISKKHPIINIEWLITGRGSMLRNVYNEEIDLDLLNSFSEIKIEQMIQDKVDDRNKKELRGMLSEILIEVKTVQDNRNR